MCRFEISAHAIYSNIKLDHGLPDMSLRDLRPSVLFRYQYYFRSIHFIIKLDPSTSSQTHLPLASYQPYSTRPSCFWAFNLPILSANNILLQDHCGRAHFSNMPIRFGHFEPPHVSKSAAYHQLYNSKIAAYASKTIQFSWAANSFSSGRFLSTTKSAASLSPFGWLATSRIVSVLSLANSRQVRCVF